MNRRSIVIAAVALTAAAPLASTAWADRVYHSEHLALSPVGGAPLKSGFVENIHPNGPQVFAHEIYSLKGAAPETTYLVYLLVHLGNPGCAGTATNFGSTELKTNAVGNGTADRFIPSAPDSIRNQTHGVRWEVTTADGTLVYKTECTNVTLD